MSNNKEKFERIKEISKYVRTTALDTIMKANNGHIGGNMSSVELLTTLYFGGLFRFDTNDSKNDARDRVLIRGHEGPLRYTIFSLLGYIKPEELNTYRSLGSRLQGHEDMHVTPGVDITPSGSLGMLLSYGVGASIANSNKQNNARTIVFLGDGEEQEGNISEAARHAAKLGLNNLICIIDKNKKQLSGPTCNSDGNTDIKKVWEGYGWDVLEIKNGNDIAEIYGIYEKLQSISKPTMVIANTTKGYGVEGAIEHFSGYHTLSSVPDKSVVLDSLERMKEQLITEGLTYDLISSEAKSMISIPPNSKKRNTPVEKSIFDIRTTQSGINVEDAEDMYIKELKERILKCSIKPDMYFITPDLLRTDQSDKIGFPEFAKYYNVGIREQHAIAMCHGISVENPDARIYVCYGDAFAYRSLDQINSAATGGSNIMIVGEPSGIFQGKNGKTHQSVGQPMGIMSIPEVTLYEPADSVDLYNVFSNILTENKGVNYVRLHHGNLTIERNAGDIQNNHAYFVHKSDKEAKMVIISTGFMAENAVAAAKELETEYDIPVNVINLVCPKKVGMYLPYLLTNCAPILTLYNGDPSIIRKYVSEAILSNPDIIKPLFIESHGFLEGTSGAVDDLIKYYGFDSQGIKNVAINKVLKRIHRT